MGALSLKTLTTVSPDYRGWKIPQISRLLLSLVVLSGVLVLVLVGLYTVVFSFNRSATIPASQRQTPSSLTNQAVAPGQPAQPWNCDQLDYGIYWYGLNNASQKAYPDGRAIAGYYDPTKPTVIFIHGWQNGFIERGTHNGSLVTNARHEFGWKAVDPTDQLNVANGWIEQGWNVGIFHWTQLADDEGTFIGAGGGIAPLNAQAKIWSADRGLIKMRWRKCDLSYEDRDGQMPTRPVKDLFYDEYKAALAQYTGPEIRLAGHSLGAQLEVATAKMLYDDTTLSTLLKPRRIALLDPYWAPPNPGLESSPVDSYSQFMPGGKYPGEVARNYIKELKTKGVVFEWTTTSGVNEWGRGDANRELKDIISNTVYHLDFLPNSLFGFIVTPDYIFSRHTAGFKLYFWSQAFEAPNECTRSSVNTCIPTGRKAHSARTDNVRTREIMDPDWQLDTSDGGTWEQVTGRNTPTPADDTFKCIQRCPTTQPVAAGSSDGQLAADEKFRVVMRWDNPGDNDLHLWGPTDGPPNHSFYNQKTIALGSLDVDDRTQLGPETFRANGTGGVGTYRIGVNCYVQCANSTPTIWIYLPGPTPQLFGPYTYKVTLENRNSGYPITGSNQSWWRVADVVLYNDSSGVLRARVVAPGINALNS